ncbi:hypothetical protein GCM10010271_73600 [Streptomyces kurssanovii]|nr:hypothetical protein GCM10010271_73600 [Streptomyces kurssanovii]
MRLAAVAAAGSLKRRWRSNEPCLRGKFGARPAQGAGKDDRTGAEADVAEPWGKLPIEEIVGFVGAALSGEFVDQPEAAQQECALRLIDAVGGMHGQVLVEEAVAGAEPICDGACRRNHAGMVSGYNAPQ